MHIKSIILDGFKSYAKRTEVKSFDKEFNAITGLNGTGKSNILDSICFVLGISSLSQVRVNSLQDLIFKSGQAGITKATVSIVFDNTNTNQSPPGYENNKELIITRQVELGGKNKYMINGVTVQNKKVNELFCSIQLNINNPHFLIMQGKVTKVLNMKPMEILAMIEEAAGIRIYEAKKEVCLKLLKKKNDKIAEFDSIIEDELKPVLAKLMKDRNVIVELNSAKQSAHKLEGLYKCFMYLSSKNALAEVESNLAGSNADINSIESKIEGNRQKISEIDAEIERCIDKAAKETMNKLNAELKEREKEQSKQAATVKSTKQNIESEKTKLKDIQKNLEDDTNALKSKEIDLAKLRSSYEELRGGDHSDKATYDALQRQYEALIAGMEINEEGQAETLLEQLSSARGCVTQAVTNIEKAQYELKHRNAQLKEKEPLLNRHKNDYMAKKQTYDVTKQEFDDLQKEISKIDYSENAASELKESRNALNTEVRNMREYMQNFSARVPQANFKYNDPEPNFDRSRVLGVVYTLFECDPKYYFALETAAGSRILNVVVDTSQTSKLILANGKLQVRTTIIPLDQIQANPISQRIVDYAKNLVGAENVDSALSLVKYDKRYAKAMAYVFGDVLICRTIQDAKALAFDQNVRRKCVTLGGDVVDPSGVLSGGAVARDGSLLNRLKDFNSKSLQLRQKLQDIAEVENKLYKVHQNAAAWSEKKKKLDVIHHNLQLQTRQIEMTKYHELQEDIKNIKQNIAELNELLTTSRETERKNKQKIAELEEKLKDSEGYKRKELKRIEQEMSRLKSKATDGENMIKKYEQDLQIMELDMTELRKGIETVGEQIAACEKVIVDLQRVHDEQNALLKEKCDRVVEIVELINKEKQLTKQKETAIRDKEKVKEKLQAEIADWTLDIKKLGHNNKKLEEDYKRAEARNREYSMAVEKLDPSLIVEAEKMTADEGRKVALRLKSLEEKIKGLTRIVNPHAQSMYEEQEKRQQFIEKTKTDVEADKKELLQMIKDLDHRKQLLLNDAVKQIKRDFGSIFSTLLPGANCTLQPLLGKPITQGIDIKVSLGNIWKESLAELSGGQRSLVALSLILSMLLFKPAPFYILDEIDAALDMSHTQNIGLMIKKHFKKSQFIIVSLKDDMFTNANVLFKTAFIDGASSVMRVANAAR